MAWWVGGVAEQASIGELRADVDAVATVIETDLVESAIERQRLRATYLDALRYRANCVTQRDDWEAGLDLGHAMLKVDVCLEEAHRVLMQSYTALGNRTQAIRQFELCRDVLKQELGLDA